MWIVEDVFFRFIVFLVEVDFFVWVFSDVYMLVMVFILVDQDDVIFFMFVNCIVWVGCYICWVQVVFVQVW